MTYYMVDTYHGPLIMVQRATDWIIASPYRSVEIYDGLISESCLESAQPISEREARAIVPDLPGEPTLELGSLELGNLERGNLERGNLERGNLERGNLERGNLERGNLERGNTAPMADGGVGAVI